MAHLDGETYYACAHEAPAPQEARLTQEALRRWAQGFARVPSPFVLRELCRLQHEKAVRWVMNEPVVLSEEEAAPYCD